MRSVSAFISFRVCLDDNGTFECSRNLTAFRVRTSKTPDGAIKGWQGWQLDWQTAVQVFSNALEMLATSKRQAGVLNWKAAHHSEWGSATLTKELWLPTVVLETGPKSGRAFSELARRLELDPS